MKETYFMLLYAEIYLRILSAKMSDKAQETFVFVVDQI